MNWPPLSFSPFFLLFLHFLRFFVSFSFSSFLIAFQPRERAVQTFLKRGKGRKLRKGKKFAPTKGITIFIDPAAVMFLVGSEMDWNESKFSSGFDFKNPNEIARCGCGESFSVSPSA